MTSEGELQKTSEFLRRRKLRFQQVREQSKDIAKIIRQRAKVEKLRQVVELDAKKEKDYLQSQEKVVNKLEQLYSKGLKHVGTSHKNATGLRQPDQFLEGTDLSRQRGKEATAELKRKQQQKLDERKKSLDRKVQAREAANVISREKSTTAANKLSTKPSSSKLSDSKSDSKSRGDPAEKSASKNSIVDNDCGTELPNEVNTNDMATQWDAEILPNEWEPHVPALVIPKDDSTKGSLGHDTETTSQKQRRPNLFAVSDEMPSSLRGSRQDSETAPSKPSLTLVSEYIQNRALRLREPEPSSSSKKQSEDLQTLKQTILRTRSSKTEGSAFSNICHVLEGQVIPVPTWHAENSVQNTSTNTAHYKQYPNERRQFANVTNSEINKIFSSIRPGQSNLTPTVLRRIRPSICKCSEGQKQTVHPCNDERLLRGHGSGIGLTKKKSVTMYNHCTKDTRDVPCAGEKIVFRDTHSERDAYSEALDEAAASRETATQEKQSKTIQDSTSRIAVTRQNVEKEYQDTMAFLNGLPRNKGAKPINIAYKDDRRLQMQRESRQRVLQQEFKNIEKESGQQGSLGNKSKSPVKCQRKKSKSPSGVTFDDNFNARDFQYSWMPVPESDGNLAVHTIPTAVKEGKSGNSVKFSKVDSYHEYRSRHKHTPPTKDTNNQEKRSNTRYVETVIIQQRDDNSSSASSIASDNSCTEDLRAHSENSKHLSEPSQQLTDTERIIIYKILDYKNTKSGKSAKKIQVDGIQSSKGIAVEKKIKSTNRDKESQMEQPKQDTDLTAPVKENALLVDNLDPSEGIYKVDSENGDNIASMYYSDSLQEDGDKVAIDESKPTCSRNEKYNAEKQFNEGPCKSDGSKNQQLRKHCIRFKCKCVDKSTSRSHSPVIDPSMNASTISFKTASQAKPNSTPEEGDCVKLIDDVGKETGNIFIGATGFLKDDAYEVVIQLRKKGVKEETKKHDEEVTKKNLPSGKDTNNTEKTAVLESADNIQSKATSIDQSPESIENPQITTVNQDAVIVSNVTTGNFGQNKENREQQPQNSPLSKTAPTFRQHDRSVSTSFKNEYAIRSNVPKTDPMPRPATSCHTQTTLSSPNSRPMLIHMSSSTSTAYMSPPEVVLPDFFKRGYESCNEAYQNIDDERRAFTEQKPFYKKNSGCRCKRCVRATKKYLSKVHTELEVNHLKTPPNTARSLSTDVESDSVPIHKFKKGSSHSSPVSSTRCHKCKTKEKSKICCKNHSQKNKYQLMSNKVLLSRSTRSASLYNRKSKKSCNASKNTKKSYLNPMIKDYINKLLSLNQEGIKAIQIVNQECSSVNTPASSIINVPSNVCSNITDNDVLKNEISLEQIKHFLRGQFCYALRKRFQTQGIPRDLKTESFILKSIKSRRKHLKKKTHKVKSLNISKRNRIHFCDSSRSFTRVNTSARETARNVRPKTHNIISSVRNESYRKFVTEESKYDDTSSMKKALNIKNQHPSANVYEHKLKNQHRSEDTSSEQPKTIISSGSATPDRHVASTSNGNPTRQPINTSTQTSGNINNDINFMKLAEDKLQNMEKIADLTEKCTKRLSNLAKVLEEVRKNKSLAYSQVSTSDSTDSDQKSDRVVVTERNEKRSSNSVIDLNDKTEIKSPTIVNSTEEKGVDSTDYESLLLGIPKPGYIKYPHSVDSENELCCDNIIDEAASKKAHLINTNAEYRVSSNPKCRSKPPPALLRIHLKRPQENVVPHELSTVIEVDSPMSVKLKNQSSNVDNAIQSMKNSFEARTEEKFSSNVTDEEPQINPVLRQSISIESNNSKIKMMTTDSSDESKLRMMDLNQFNEIMLRPFISLQQYAQDYYEDDVVSKRESVSKDTGLIDDISSLHSDGSLPDVVAELLKRKLITEPFKFDNASNVNSTTVSSESTLSVLALSKARRDKTKSKIIKNKENIAETSDALSISSNPDLENAFKKLGMGWASSTLKKTKERLALSSSSNTSSSSLSQFKFKNSTKQDMPTIVTDSVSSVPNLSKKPVPRYLDISKNAEQQTSFTNSMTVKEFLTNELAKKITFTNKSSRNETNEEFVSLLETKMPEELKKSSLTIKENSSDSIPSGNNNRARTSTPVQIFKSVTYHSSSSSNVSNGLFSNADDLSSVKLTSTSMRNHSTSEKDELTIPNYSLKKMRKPLSDCSKTDSC